MEVYFLKNKFLIIFGAGQQAEIISFYLKKLSRSIFAYCVDDDFYKEKKFLGKNIITTSELLKKFKPNNYNLHIAISYSNLNSIRRSKFIFFKKKKYNFENIIINHNYINTNKRIGENVVIIDSFIQPGVIIGDNTIIWSGCTVGHHTTLGNHCWLSSGVSVGGNCKIKESSFFGMNGTIGHFVSIGANCFIGSGVHITKNISKNKVVIQPDSKTLSFDAKKFTELKKFK